MLISSRPVSIEAGFSSRYLKIDLEATKNRPVNPTGPVITEGAGHDRVRHQQSFVVCIFNLQIIPFSPVFRSNRDQHIYKWLFVPSASVSHAHTHAVL